MVRGESGEPLCDQRINKCLDMFAGVLGHVFGILAYLFLECIEVVIPVKELPQADARRVQAKTTTGVGVKENGPVVKLLPE